MVSIARANWAWHTTLTPRRFPADGPEGTVVKGFFGRVGLDRAVQGIPWTAFLLPQASCGAKCGEPAGTPRMSESHDNRSDEARDQEIAPREPVFNLPPVVLCLIGICVIVYVAG